MERNAVVNLSNPRRVFRYMRGDMGYSKQSPYPPDPKTCLTSTR